jgi:hypothetical protein
MHFYVKAIVQRAGVWLFAVFSSVVGPIKILPLKLKNGP